MSPESRYHPWIACALSLCCTGLGHLYVGRLLRGLTLFLMSLILIPAAALVAGMTSSTGALVGLMGAMGVLVVLWIVAVLDAGRIAAKTPRTAPHDYQRPLVYGLFLVAGLCAPALSVAYVRQNLLEAFYIPTKSMAPTLHSGDRILVNKAVWRREQLDRDDVVVFRYPDQRDRNYVKRIIGMPGDVVTIDGDEIRVNGQPIERTNPHSQGDQSSESSDQKQRPGQPPPDRAGNQRKIEQRVPPATCFVLGDNYKNSRDSREFGPVPLGDVLGVAEYIFCPGDSWSRFGRLR